MNEWKKYKLGEIASVIMGQSPKSENYTRDSSYIPFLQGNRTFGRLYPSYDTYCIAPIKIADKGDILMSVRAPVGDLNISDRKVCIGRGLCSIRIIKDFHNLFIYYLLKYNINRIINQETGSVFGSINKTIIENFEILAPDLPTQRQIAQILSSLDDKIELNLQMNQTLEAIAQAIFKEWFVNFNFPGFDGVLVDGLPKGWRKGNVLEIATLLSGGTPKTSEPEYWDGDINWISAKDITSSNNQFIIETEKKITELGIKKSAAKLLPTFTTIISARGTVGNFCILPKEMAISQSNYGLKSNSNFDFFLVLLVKDMILMMKAFAYGAVFDTITTRTFQAMEITIPDNQTIEEFEELIRPIYSKILTNQLQIQSLTKTRDTLLPKLMSGQIRLNYDF